MPPPDSTEQGTVDLSLYRNPPDLDKGRGLAVRVLWHFANALFLQSALNPSSGLKVAVLRLFGAKVGAGCVLKPGISVKSPWNLTMGDHCWIGERAWIDSLAPVTLGSHVCLSQDVYLCCGNHDWADPAFGKTVSPITVEDGAWIATRATVMPGVIVRSHAVVAAGAVLARSAEPYTVYAGVPAVVVKTRTIRPRSA